MLLALALPRVPPLKRVDSPEGRRTEDAMRWRGVRKCVRRDEPRGGMSGAAVECDWKERRGGMKGPEDDMIICGRFAGVVLGSSCS